MKDFEFKGWLESTTGKVVDTLPATAPDANTVYTAQWEAKTPDVKTHKINYYLVKGGALYDSDEFEEGKDIAFITPAANDITGFEFIKWVDAEGNDIDPKMGLTMKTSVTKVLSTSTHTSILVTTRSAT